MSRAQTMTTHRLVRDFEICVPESQREEYAAVVGAERVLTHPDAVRGLTPKLNWIFDHVADDEAIVFLDDDLTAVQRCFTSPGEPGTIRDPDLVQEIIRGTFLLARDVGAFYFGWEASNGAVRYYTGLKPIMRTGYINGCAMGFRTGHGLRFDERIVAKNDFDIAAANARRHRTCLKNVRYTFCQKETFVGKGGQAAHRNSETERRDVELLRRKWGGEVFPDGGHSGSRKRAYAGVQKITMRLPF